MSEQPFADNPEFVPEWDVLRDDNGDPVTITEQQSRAIWRALSVVEAVRKSEGYRSLWEHPNIEIGKSRLLGRMLFDGRPPTRTMPPLYAAGGAWHLLPGGDPFGEQDDLDRYIAERSAADPQFAAAMKRASERAPSDATDSPSDDRLRPETSEAS